MIQDCLSTVSNGLAATGRCAKSVALGVGHVSLLGTAAVADLCGTTVLVAGSAAAGVLGVDSLLWYSDKPPIWAHFSGHASPIVLGLGSLSKERIEKELKQAISVEAVASLALAVGSPIASYACFKVAHLARQIDQNLFQTAQ